MDFSMYCTPINMSSLETTKEHQLIEATEIYSEGSGFPDLASARLAIIGVAETRGASCEYSEKGLDKFRSYFYSLYSNWSNLSLVDLGNIKPGETLNDTYFALSQVVSECAKLNVIPIIIGGSQDLTFSMYKAYEELEQVVNIVSVDKSLDLGDIDSEISSTSFLNKIILHQPNYLFNYSNIGYQTYFVSPEERDLMDKLFFDIHRLGEVRADMKEVEPVVRNADIVSFDLGSIRHSDAPGVPMVSPNGFYGEEACQITRYAGLSDKLSSIGFFELDASKDLEVTSHLLAQMVWYFIEGYQNRKHDGPNKQSKEYLKYRVASTDVDGEEIIFYKNLMSDRWWMNVPYPASKIHKYRRHQMIPCSFKDYLAACNAEVPDKWLKNYSKFS